MTLTHGTISSAEDTGFPAQELFCGKAGAGFSDQTLLSLPPPTPLLPGLSPKMAVRDSQIHPLCLRVVLGRKVPKIETHLSHLEEVGAQGLETQRHRHRRLGAPGNHPGFPSWCFYIFLETQSMLLPSRLQLTRELHRPPSPKPQILHALFAASPDFT